VAVVASVERFVYKGVASNLVTYLTGVVGMSTSAAAKSVSIWSGVNFMLPLFSAILTDSYYDRYSTITGSSSVYVLVSIAASPNNTLLFFDARSFHIPTSLFEFGVCMLIGDKVWKLNQEKKSPLLCFVNID
jgi:dipeptide/tripeptide permease